MKRLLLITYHYPPSSAVGAVRPSKFAKFLPEFGWQPTVLTVRAADSANDPDVIRIQEWPHPLKSYERLKGQRAAKRGISQEDFAAQISLKYDEAVSPVRRGWGLKRWIACLLWLPDREVGWIPPAVYQAWRLIRQRRITHMITTGPPWTCHLVGLLIKRLTGMHWIADFRDPWSLKHKFPLFRNSVTDAVERALIGSVMRHADFILSVTAAMTDEVRKDWPGIDPEKFVTLPSGFDPADFEGLSRDVPAVYPSVPVLFSYFGTFYHGRTPEPFLRALRDLRQDGRISENELTVRFVGQVKNAEGVSVPRLVAAYGLEGVVTLVEPVPRREALRQMLQTHVALVLDERHPIQIPLKLYDALAAGQIVFNIGGRGAVAEVLAKTGRGVVADHANQAEIEDGILTCLRMSREPGRFSQEPWSDRKIQAYHFRSLTGQVVRLLDGVDR
jgi:glycosyltransferase involved in cell wall biosynthesis